jgi:hypothetical protein
MPAWEGATVWYGWLFGIGLCLWLGAMTQRKIFAFLALGGLGSMSLYAWASHRIELATDYQPVVATVMASSATCYAEEWDNRMCASRLGRGRPCRRRPLEKTGNISCVAAEALERNTPVGEIIPGTSRPNTVWDDMHVKGTIQVSFSYLAPADGSVRQGMLEYEYRDYKRLMGIGRNDKLPILAHQTHPALVAQDYGRMDRFETAN